MRPANQGKITDPQQAMMNTMMNFMPLMVIIFGWNFASGAVLYWAVQSIYSVVQQWFITGWGSMKDWFPRLPEMPEHRRLGYRKPMDLDSVVVVSGEQPQPKGLMGWMQRRMEEAERQAAARRAAQGKSQGQSQGQSQGPQEGQVQTDGGATGSVRTVGNRTIKTGRGSYQDKVDRAVAPATDAVPEASANDRRAKRAGGRPTANRAQGAAGQSGRATANGSAAGAAGNGAGSGTAGGASGKANGAAPLPVPRKGRPGGKPGDGAAG
jgi:YidC/Oxa1 family membrane protein insertase